MPTVRYQIRSEYGLSDPALYGAAEKDDPEALLEGVAMAGLVGLLRQLGDLAEFAAEIFHDLHEEVMATACRGHGLTLRLRQLEAEFTSVESSLVSQISLPNVLQNDGVEFHANIQTDRNLIMSGDMPRFVMDSYEECRGPPRLFTLDKFDVAGAGACLKRYSDPSFFKTEMSKSSDSVETEDSPREKKPRKIKKKAFRLRKGETLESLLISSSKSQPSTENQAPIVRRVKLKSRESQNSENNNNTRKSHHSILVGLIESQQQIFLSNSEKDLCFKKEQNGMITKPESLLNEPSDYVELERETNGEVQKMHKIFPIQEQNGFSSESDKIETQKENENEIGSLNQTKDKILGDSNELENFVDALNTIESETETDSEKKIHKSDPIINNNNNNNNDNNKEGLESSSPQKGLENEFDEANEEFFDNDDLMDVSSTSSWHSDGARQLDGPSVSRQNDFVIVHKSELSDLEDSKALSVNKAELNDEQAHENLEDLPSSMSENHAEQIDSPLKNQVEEPISNDSVEELEIPILNSEENIKISDETWIEKESIISNEGETKSTNESINGEDSSVSKLEGAIEGQLVREDSLVSNEEKNLRNESINETFNVQDSSVSNKEGNFTSDDIISEGLEDPNFSANKLEETNENHNEVSQVELKNISDEILNLEEYLISNRDYDNIASNKSLNEKDGSLLDTQSEKVQDDFTDALQSDQKYKSDEILNHEDLISFREEENIPTCAETMNLPKHIDRLESEENADYLSGEKDERNFEETLIQPNENTLLFQEPKDHSHEPFSPKSQMDDCPEPVRALLDLGETLNPKQEEENSLKTQETLNPKEEEENSLQTLHSFEEIQQQHEKDWQTYLFEEESKVDSVKQIQENEPIHYNFVNNFNLLDKSESHERYSENPFETNTHLEENAQNLILWSDNEEEYETLVEEFNAGAKQEFPNSDFLWEPASPPRESTIEPLVTSLSQNGAPTVCMDQVHHEPEPDRLSDASNKSECESGLQDHSVDQVHELLPNDSESKACENELLVESFDEKEEVCVDSGLPSPTADQVHHELWEISDPPVEQVHELSGLSEPAMDQVYEPSGLSDPYVDQVNEQFGPSDRSVDEVNEQSLLEDLDSKSNEPLTEKDWIKPGFFPTVSVGFNHEQSELSNETNISQSDELSMDKIVPSLNLGFDNNQSKEENSDVKPHDFSRDSCTNEKPSINASINETDEKPLINALSTPFTDLDDTNPNPSGPSIDPKPIASIPSIVDPNPNPNSINRDIFDIFSSISQSSNTSSQNEDKPPPLPPLGWRLGGKLRKGISLPLNGFLPALKPDPFGELPCIDEPKQDDIGNNSNDLFKSINVPDPFVELHCIVEPKQDDIGNDSDLFKAINAPEPFVELPCIVEPKQDDIGSNSDPFVKPINVSDPSVEMPCIVEPKQDDIATDSDLFKPVTRPDPFVELLCTVEPKQDDISNDSDLFKPVITTDPFETRSESDSQKESEVLSNDCTDDLQKQEREREKPPVVSLFDLPPISNPNPQVDPLLGQNVQDFEHKAGPNPDPSTNVLPISNPNSQPNPISGQNVQKFEHKDPNPDPITILPTISNPNPPTNPNLGQNLQTFETNGGSNPDPITNLRQISNPTPQLNPQNPDPNPSNLPPIPNPNPPPNRTFSSDPSPNLFLPAGYLIPLEENLWARYGIGPAIEDERLGRKNTAYSIRNIPRNPLMDAVAAHDRTTMRKVSELVRPTDESKSYERNSLLEQIRNKSFSLRPVSTPKTTAVKAPQTNLKVAAIVEKANAIRQACVGSDEEDEDSWSDA